MIKCFINCGKCNQWLWLNDSERMRSDKAIANNFLDKNVPLEAQPEVWDVFKHFEMLHS